MRLLLTFLLFALSGSVFAQSGLSGVRAGFVYDVHDKAIRPVNGMPGAAYIGDALDLNGLKLDSVEISGSTAYGTANGVYYRIDLANGKASALQGIMEGSTLVAPGLFWHASSRFLQTESRKTFVSAEGELLSGAWNDATSCAALAFDTGNVESICGETQSTLLSEPSARITRLIAVGAGFVALDASAQSRVLELGATKRVLAAAPDLAKPVGIAKVSDQLVAVANAGSQQLRFVALNDAVAVPDPIDLRFKPTTLRRLSGDILQLGEAGSDPFEVVDFAQQGRAFFIPASMRSEK